MLINVCCLMLIDVFRTRDVMSYYIKYQDRRRHLRTTSGKIFGRIKIT